MLRTFALEVVESLGVVDENGLSCLLIRNPAKKQIQQSSVIWHLVRLEIVDVWPIGSPNDMLRIGVKHSVYKRIYIQIGGTADRVAIRSRHFGPGSAFCEHGAKTLKAGVGGAMVGAHAAHMINHEWEP